MQGPAAARGTTFRSYAWGAAALGGVAFGVGRAASLAWLCDDAFVSFRYAQNLVRGLGLVFNAGERVEGFTNPSWTVFVALGMKLGVAAERWSIAWGLVFHAATLLLLAGTWLARRRAQPDPYPVPLACLAWALHRDAAVYATSGLETSAFTFLVLAGFVLSARADTPRRAAAAGFVLALASVTRPEGPLLAAVTLPFVATATPGRRTRALATTGAFIGAFLVLWAPVTLARAAYYGSFFPNTYWAKSASIAWWSQGLVYVGLYARRYWPIVLSVPLAGFVAADRRVARRLRREVALATALALGYATYVARVGGDFMFARVLVPVTPLLLVGLERSLDVVWRGRRVVAYAAAVVCVAGVAFTPSGLAPGVFVHGITDERAFYEEFLWRNDYWRRWRGGVMRRVLEGLPARAAFMQAQAGLVYYAELPVAVEASTGLTDATIAHQPLPAGQRGRPGHEKTAPLDYLIETRRLHFVIGDASSLHLEDHVPIVVVHFDDRTSALLLHWDPAFMASIAARGATFPDVPAEIDAFERRMDALPDDQVRVEYAKLRRFYFQFVDDPERETPFRARLARGPR